MLKKPFKIKTKSNLDESKLKQIAVIEENAFKDSYYYWSSLKELYDSSSHEIFFIEVNAEVIAYCIFALVIDEIEIYKIYVATKYRRMQLGTALIKQIEANQAISKIFVDVNENNLKARKFYEHLGFKMLKIRKHYYQNQDDAINLLKILK
ncbi:MAG: GNAT family N-acetyltransferase [Mycoplasmoidaceae bacterium]